MAMTAAVSATSHAQWSSAGVSHSVFAVEGMRCSACSRAISRAVGHLRGVERISVNAATGRAAVDWDPAKITLTKILDTVATAGFRALPLSGETALGQQRAERRTALKRIGLAGLGMMQAMMFVYCLYAGGAHGIDPGIAQYLKLAGLLIATPVLVYSGAPFFAGALRSLRRKVLSMDVTVALALALAYGASVFNTLRGKGEIYFDSVTMFIFFLLAGRFIEMTVRQNNMSATEALARSLPATVTRIRADGAHERVSPASLEAGDRLVIPKGAVIPVDSRLTRGEAMVDESLLTGESVPIPKHPDARLSGGSINIGQPIEVIATAPASESLLASIVSLLERAQAERPALARTADRVASWFVVLTVTLALGSAAFWLFVDPVRALPAALAVLVVTCPCALSLATPAALASATTRLARAGLLVTQPDALERLARVTHVVIDKTGTLTCGAPTIVLQTIKGGYSREEALRIAAALETASEHPIALAFHPFGRAGCAATHVKEHVGRGVEGMFEGRCWRLGTRHFVTGVAPDPRRDDTGIVLGNADGIVATFVLTDRLRPDALDAIRDLKAMGLRVSIASGDQPQVVNEIAHQLGIREAAGRLTPAQKLTLVQQHQARGAQVLMVGDGINDGPVLASAAVSCAMAQGSAIAQAAADLLLLSDSLGTLALGIQTARRMKAVIRQNLSWALAYNLAAVPLAALGWIPPWVAAVGMSTSSLLVVLNAARLASAQVPSRPTRHRP